ncbi:MAG: C1 family peptidase [Companilactobacillus sp.]|uniref:aminopeptidase C n=1 Tax=Companilactobacillus sp. TaxID=2767905 RepID=UPI0025BA4407|nr:C1 family peptidase [Companilactobacillus sp.]MCH4050476.1 C1 family peptidase [Companilactobacillus sp.]MCI1342404.1 C1 family peptidase [Companilactobacillus sp.]MCI1369174.1 C1 family peptidase [Companilactobacillus sp.]MCI1425935.1 C1 family peptidase [Companilactobacillus sp.]MCI1468254.1 C1 family peptidase [Companilactobacillus sp.]
MINLTKEINKASLADFHENLNHDVSNNALRHAVAEVGIYKAAQNIEAKSKLNPAFNVEVPTGKVTNQKRSGRCWLFSTLTNLRTEFATRYNVKDFELSENYLSFYDRLEKANYFFQNIIQTADMPLTDRKVNWLFASPSGDGGQWQYGANLIKKYGVVPSYAMPETVASENTSEFNSTLNNLLRKDGMEIRQMIKDSQPTDERVQEMLSDVYRICVYSFGQPPVDFELSIKDDNGKMIEDPSITPKDFFKNYFAIDLNDYISVMNSPQTSKKYNQSYTIDTQGNIVGGEAEKFFNLPIERLKELTIQQLKANDTVWFGNDVGKQSERSKGLLFGDLYQYDQLFGIDTKLDKGDALDTRNASVSHAMVFTGVNLINDAPNRWKVENSWGEANGDKGYFTMDDKWFDENVYEVVINKKYLTSDELAAFDQEPIVLPAWDAME